MQILISLLAGLVFGVGLIVAGMTDPARVLAFLDLAGAWNPSLALVMGGAILVALPAFALAAKRQRSLLGADMQLPTATRIDRRLALGALAFGVGWGLVGLCPGPALVLISSGNSKLALFVLSMLAGMLIFEWLERRRAAKPASH
ncbi:MAG: YeeE/YedE family protein [Duganella sp.]